MRSIGHWQYCFTSSCSVPASPDLTICIQLFPSLLWNSSAKCFWPRLYHVYPVGSIAGLVTRWNFLVRAMCAQSSPFPLLYFHFYCRLLYSFPQLFIVYFIRPWFLCLSWIAIFWSWARCCLLSIWPPSCQMLLLPCLFFSLHPILIRHHLLPRFPGKFRSLLPLKVSG